MGHNKAVYISYSWSSGTHIENVRRLASSLVRDGIEVKIDIWELKTGDDVNVFMRSMVDSEEIQSVLVICDQEYKLRAEAGVGGIGAEADIMKEAIHGQSRQDKFIPVVFEKDEKGDPYLPSFLASRLYIDMSSSDRFVEGYELLLRQLYDVPLHSRPQLGSPPSNLFTGKDTEQDVEKVRNWQQKIIEYGDEDFVVPLFQYFGKTKDRNPEAILLLGDTIAKDLNNHICNVLLLVTDPWTILNVLNKFGLTKLFLERVIAYAQKVEIKRFENHKYTEILLKLWNYFDDLHGLENSYIKALYRHVSQADENRQLGWDDYGINMIRSMIRLLPSHLVILLLEEYKRSITGHFPSYAWFTAREEHQIQTIIRNSSFNEKQKEKMEFKYTQGFYVRIGITSSIYKEICSLLSEDYNKPRVKNLDVFANQANLRFFHKYTDQEVLYKIGTVEDVIHYHVEVRGKELIVAQWNMAEDGMIDVEGTYGNKNFRIRETDHRKLEEKVKERLRIFFGNSLEMNPTDNQPPEKEGKVSISLIKPSVFIGSSSQAKQITTAIHANLEEETEPTPWDIYPFQLNNSTLDGLIAALDKSDFAVFLLAPDDQIIWKGQQMSVARDNVLFELGLAIGKLGKERTFFLAPKDLTDFHTPTDLLGITSVRYDSKRSNNYKAATLTACDTILSTILELGPRTKEVI
ncbi:hypothetical protein BK126_04610 [Paenibacillus sp. FSL H7-0326]|uniref:TIR domain-containing protein n=1 Tax=Paenibacillus sp. FSL H7-0326 TaxID=1921144 RepID=UPI00096E38DD|nr:TIR domain-containing protein [Paenibacillus sp. FSL H7-0326]OMC71382.1 hypothetical protein BK126_04610 [Paenibacillus sp. FSL H7-0326]